MNMNQERRTEVGTTRLRALVVLTIVTLLLGAVAVAGATGDATTTTTGDPAPTSTESSTPDGTEPGITAGGGGGGNVNNEVVVLNSTDGRFAHRAGSGIARVTGDTVENQNAAAATSSCTDCRTVAVAVQIVLVQRSDAATVSPRNLAVAINAGCVRCETFAAAYQYVLSTDGLVRFTPAGQQRLAELQAQLRSIAATDGVPFYELEAQLDAVVEQIWAVADAELAKVGQRPDGTAGKDTDIALEDSTASPTGTPTESAGGTEPSATPSNEPSDATSPAPSESTSPTGSPTTEEPTTSSEEASPSPSESPTS